MRNFNGSNITDNDFLRISFCLYYKNKNTREKKSLMGFFKEKWLKISEKA